MKNAYIFFADGFEDIEGLMVVDLFRRAGIHITTVSITDSPEVVTSHQVPLRCDTTFAAENFDDADILILPGGMPGTTHLKECEPLRRLLLEHAQKGTRIAAICAAPTVLSDLGLLKDRSVTSYPSCEPQIEAARYLQERVVVDGNITTSRGLGTAIDFALSLIGQLLDAETAEKISTSVVNR